MIVSDMHSLLQKCSGKYWNVDDGRQLERSPGEDYEQEGRSMG